MKKHNYNRILSTLILLLCLCVQSKVKAQSMDMKIHTTVTDTQTMQMEVPGGSTVIPDVTDTESPPQITIAAPRIEAEALDDSSVRIVWKKVTSATKYEVYRATAKNGTYKKIKVVTQKAYTDKSVRRAKTYYYKVLAIRSGKRENGSSSFSNVVSVTPKLTIPVFRKSRQTEYKVELNWKTYKYVTKYVVYRANDKDGKYKKIGTTKKQTFLDKSIKANKVYYYKVQAQGKSTEGKKVTSALSRPLKVKTPKHVVKTAYVGDSVMSGMSAYKIITGKNQKVITKIGVSPYNFYNGSIMDTLLDYRPDRIYIMLGMNSLVGSPSEAQMDSIIRYYRKILEECMDENPEVHIVILPVSPTRTDRVKNSTINSYNKKLKKLAQDLKVEYYDYTDYLKNPDGTLKAGYSAGDGIHWKIDAYRKLKEKLEEHENSYK